MSRSDASIEQLEDQLDGAARTLSGLGAPSEQQAQRVAQRMDRLASQLLEVSAPPPIASVHKRLGSIPGDPDELIALAEKVGRADGEG